MIRECEVLFGPGATVHVKVDGALVAASVKVTYKRDGSLSTLRVGQVEALPGLSEVEEKPMKFIPGLKVQARPPVPDLRSCNCAALEAEVEMLRAALGLLTDPSRAHHEDDMVYLEINPAAYAQAAALGREERSDG